MNKEAFVMYAMTEKEPPIGIEVLVKKRVLNNVETFIIGTDTYKGNGIWEKDNTQNCIAYWGYMPFEEDDNTEEDSYNPHTTYGVIKRMDKLSLAGFLLSIYNAKENGDEVYADIFKSIESAKEWMDFPSR